MKLTKLKKWLGNLPIFRVTNSGLDDYLDPNDRLHKIAITTHYPVNEIHDFMLLTGLNIDDTEKIMANFSNCGISNITNVNTLVKLGFFHYC